MHPFPTRALIAMTFMGSSPGMQGVSSPWVHTLPRVVPSQVWPGTPRRPGVPTQASRPVEPLGAWQADLVSPRQVVAATTLLGRFALTAGPQLLWAGHASRLVQPPTGADDGFAGAVHALSHAWMTMALRPTMPYMVGSLAVDTGHAALVVSPLGEGFASADVLPLCVRYEGENGGERQRCGLLSVAGGTLSLPGASRRPWVAATIPTPFGPRLALDPLLLGHGLHVAAHLPAAARADFAQDIEVASHTAVIDTADAIAARFALDFANGHQEHRRGPVYRAATADPTAPAA